MPDRKYPSSSRHVHQILGGGTTDEATVRTVTYSRAFSSSTAVPCAAYRKQPDKPSFPSHLTISHCCLLTSSQSPLPYQVSPILLYRAMSVGRSRITVSSATIPPAQLPSAKPTQVPSAIRPRSGQKRWDDDEHHALQGLPDGARNEWETHQRAGDWMADGPRAAVEHAPAIHCPLFGRGFLLGLVWQLWAIPYFKERAGAVSY